jgi:D-inositol-3-phosphate glycosyltransferase
VTHTVSHGLTRVAMLSVHTSPLDQPGTGDAGGMNVYIVELARRLALAGVEVEVFTRATSGALPPTVEIFPGVLVRHVTAGPYEGLPKEDLPAQLCALTSGVMHAEAIHHPGFYDLVHSHYWLSGHVGWLAKDRWHVPLVHSMHTLAKVKNLTLAEGDRPEPVSRIIGEEQLVAAADRLVANTPVESRQLIDLYGADPAKVSTVLPGVDLTMFHPGSKVAARRHLRIDPDALLVLFVGRIQPLKAPDVLLQAVERLLRREPPLRATLQVAIVGGPSGSGLDRPAELQALAAELGLLGVVRFVPPVPRQELVSWYQAADLVAVPSYSESFGLVAIEAQACGTPVVAARVGGLPFAVRDDVSGLLVDGHDPQRWATALGGLLLDPTARRRLSEGATTQAQAFGWDATAAAMVEVYTQALEGADPRLSPPLLPSKLSPPRRRTSAMLGT